VSSAAAEASSLTAVGRIRRLGFLAIGAVVVIYALWYAVRAFVSIETNLLWFRSVAHESVYTRTLWTEILLFALFSTLMAALLTYTLLVFYRYKPRFRPDPLRQRWRYYYSRLERHVRYWLLVVIVLYYSVGMGARASSGWKTWLAWRNSTTVGQKDAQFHRDLSYFLFVYPLHRMVLTFLFRIVATAIIALLVTAWVYGALRFRGPGPRMTPALRSQLSILLGAYFVLKAFGYWLDRYALATSNRGVVTGPSYTDVHAAIPGKFVLVIIAAICAAILFANGVLRSGRLMALAIAVLAGGALIFGVAWPNIVQRFIDKPAASQKELKYIGRNIAATRSAFGLKFGPGGNITTASLPGVASLTGPTLSGQVSRDAQISLLDPNQLSPTFQVQQQVRSFYSFKSTLDIDRYPINGQLRDVAIAPRELNTGGLPNSQLTWSNAHLTYTHGYGVVAAPTDQMTSEGLPEFVEGGIPPTGQLGLKVPQIYYGQKSNSYSIVGSKPGAPPREFDHPATRGASQANTTHTGGGAVPVGSLFHRLLYAWKLHSSSILFSSEINSHSQLIYNTNPRNRVAAVAPWLTLDGDVYPVVAAGRVEWVVDGYTTSNNYPYSQQINLRSATTTSFTQNGSSVTQSGKTINYMRNSVKAIVDAYTGQVTLYAWHQQNDPDPELRTWEKAFPGLVKPQADIPAALLPHLRYPADLFNVQRTLLTSYHISSPSAFYSGADYWRVPLDPVLTSTTTTNSLGTKVTQSAPSQPSYYMTMSPTGTSAPVFSLYTTLTTLNRLNLTAFLSVDSQPGPGYGHFTLLETSATRNLESPSQIQNDIESTSRIANALSLERAGNSRVILGNLEAIPLGGEMLYVEPIYTQSRTAATPNPILRHVVTVYADNQIGFAPTLDESLRQSLGEQVSAP
jgi:uncharacterized membrane protein (UPF0182 family)